MISQKYKTTNQSQNPEHCPRDPGNEGLKHIQTLTCNLFQGSLKKINVDKFLL